MAESLFSDTQRHYEEKREQWEAAEAEKYAVDRQTKALERIADALEAAIPQLNDIAGALSLGAGIMDERTVTRR